jgi:hypothetical protein
MSFIKVFKSGVAKIVDTTNVFKVRVGGVWKDVVSVRVYKTNGGTVGWRNVWQKSATPPPPPPPPPAPPPPPPPPPTSLSVSVSPPSAYGWRNGAGNVFTNDVTATASGGTGPYNYVWELVNWTASTPPGASAPNSDVTHFSQTGLGNGQDVTAQFKVTAVDSLNNIGSAFVNVEFQSFTSGGGGGGGPLEP